MGQVPMDSGQLAMPAGQLETLLSAINDFRTEIMKRLDRLEEAHEARFQRVEGRVSAIELARATEAAAAAATAGQSAERDNSLGKWIQRGGQLVAAAGGALHILRQMGVL